MRLAVAGAADQVDGEVAQAAIDAWAARRLRTFEDAERGLCFGRLDFETIAESAVHRPAPHRGRRRRAGCRRWCVGVATPFYRATLADPFGLAGRRRFVFPRRAAPRTCSRRTSTIPTRSPARWCARPAARRARPGPGPARCATSSRTLEAEQDARSSACPRIVLDLVFKAVRAPVNRPSGPHRAAGFPALRAPERAPAPRRRARRRAQPGPSCATSRRRCPPSATSWPTQRPSTACSALRLPRVRADDPGELAASKGDGADGDADFPRRAVLLLTVSRCPPKPVCTRVSGGRTIDLGALRARCRSWSKTHCAAAPARSPPLARPLRRSACCGGARPPPHLHGRFGASRSSDEDDFGAELLARAESRKARSTGCGRPFERGQSSCVGLLT